MSRLTCAFATLFSLFVMGMPMLMSSITASPQDQKLKIEDLNARHLESIGASDARAKVGSRIASGQAKYVIRVGGTANIDGQVMIVSSGVKFRIGMKFPLQEYPGEDLVFNGNTASTGVLPQGQRSPLSIFLNSQNLPLREGLLSGTLSTAWPLLRMDQMQPRLEYRGLKKIEGRQLHEVNYRPRKGSTDLKVSLYFEPETFRHVRTNYRLEISATIGTRENPNANQEVYYSLSEEFEEFRVIDGLMLPHKYKLQYSGAGNRGTLIQDWTHLVSKITHNEKVDDQIFMMK